MKLYYYQHKNNIKNFGDDLNPWIFDKLLPFDLDKYGEGVLIGIGTLLNQDKMPKAQKIAVFSSGVGYGSCPVVDDSWKIYCLRGPLSAQRLKVSEELAVTDGAILVRNYVKKAAKKMHRFSYFPHLASMMNDENAWEEICHCLEIQLIDPRWPVEKILTIINESEYLITEALHGAIVADSLRVPWIPVKSNNKFLDFKWQDWCASMNLEFNPTVISPIWENESGNLLRKIRQRLKIWKVIKQIKEIKDHFPLCLSREHQLDSKFNAMMEKSSQLRRDLLNGKFHRDLVRK